MQTSNLLMTNEKNKYLTIFESIPNPVIILNRGKKVDNMNLAATRLFKEDSVAGSQYYCVSRDRQLEMENSRNATEESFEPGCFGGYALHELLPWLKDEINRFYGEDKSATEFEKVLRKPNQRIIYRVKISKNLDVSEKFDGAVVILEDITALKNALDEVKTLRRICADLFAMQKYQRRQRVLATSRRICAKPFRGSIQPQHFVPIVQKNSTLNSHRRWSWRSFDEQMDSNLFA